MRFSIAVTLILLVSIIGCSLAEQCGRQAGGAQCPGGACCSKFGWCGSNGDYCGDGCQSQCGGGEGGGGGDLGSLISRDTFNHMLKHRDDSGCQGRGFYTYDAFISAAKAFPNFANNGDTANKKREIAAFFGQTSHETTGGWPTAPDGPNNIMTALWFWMTPQSSKPSCHDVITGRWNPSSADLAAGRFPGYGTTTNIINGGLECGIGVDTRVQDRIRFYKRYCDIFGLQYGDKLACFSQRPFGSSLSFSSLATA
ncbi:Chitinase 2, variant 2 [Trifolium repens]|nr:Chitinase 2, variant 2 [Trifolium repens]